MWEWSAAFSLAPGAPYSLSAAHRHTPSCLLPHHPPLLLRRQVNNAGIVVLGPSAEVPLETVRAAFEANVLGLLAVTQVRLRRHTYTQEGTHGWG